MMSVQANPFVETKSEFSFVSMTSQFITVGNVYSIDLDRFVSALVQPAGMFGKRPGTDESLLVIRLKGSGFLKYLKYSYYRIYYKTSVEAIKDMKIVIDAANKWQNAKQKSKVA